MNQCIFILITIYKSKNSHHWDVHSHGHASPYTDILVFFFIEILRGFCVSITFQHTHIHAKKNNGGSISCRVAKWYVLQLQAMGLERSLCHLKHVDTQIYVRKMFIGDRRCSLERLSPLFSHGDALVYVSFFQLSKMDDIFSFITQHSITSSRLSL